MHAGGTLDGLSLPDACGAWVRDGFFTDRNGPLNYVCRKTMRTQSHQREEPTVKCLRRHLSLLRWKSTDDTECLLGRRVRCSGACWMHQAAHQCG